MDLPKRVYGTHCNFSSKIANLLCSNPFFRYDHIWQGYAVAPFYEEGDYLNNSLTVTFRLYENRRLSENGGRVKSCVVRLLYKEEFDMFDDGYNTAAEYLRDHEDTQSETTTPTDYYSLDEEDLSGSGPPDEIKNDKPRKRRRTQKGELKLTMNSYMHTWCCLFLLAELEKS